MIIFQIIPLDKINIDLNNLPNIPKRANFRNNFDYALCGIEFALRQRTGFFTIFKRKRLFVVPRDRINEMPLSKGSFECLTLM